ncbi:MAG: hypothetical protein ACI376_07295, partial [Candidatus Bruticola sp.]
ITTAEQKTQKAETSNKTEITTAEQKTQKAETSNKTEITTAEQKTQKAETSNKTEATTAEQKTQKAETSNKTETATTEQKVQKAETSNKTETADVKETGNEIAKPTIVVQDHFAYFPIKERSAATIAESLIKLYPKAIFKVDPLLNIIFVQGSAEDINKISGVLKVVSNLEHK